jgi:hypothetical protein
MWHQPAQDIMTAQQQQQQQQQQQWLTTAVKGTVHENNLSPVGSAGAQATTAT